MTPSPNGPEHRLTINADAADLDQRLARVGPARDVIRSAAAIWGITAPAGDDLATIASELVANAIRHSRPGTLHVVLKLSPAGDRIRLEVDDLSHRLPVLDDRFGDDQAETGRGLLIVQALAERWGATATPAGKTVWAEITLPIPVNVSELIHAARRAEVVTDLVRSLVN